MKKALLALLCLASALLAGTASAAPPAPAETAESVEKDLAAIFRQMEAMKTELDRIEDLAAAPRATLLRVEIHGDKGVPSPAVGRFLVQGRTEEEREWSRVERDSFSDPHVPMPLVMLVPFLPGTHSARLELVNAAWKIPPGFDFQAVLRKGETTVLKLRLAMPPGKADPVLARIQEKEKEKEKEKPAEKGR